MEPVVKLTWTLLKGGLRLSAELLLTLSNSALFEFIFRACLERVKESGDKWQKIPCMHLCTETQPESSLSLVPTHPYRLCAAFYNAILPHSSAFFFSSFLWHLGIASH